MKETQSNSALDTNSSQPPASTPVVTGLHKEDQQATGGSTSLGVTSEEGANPQISSVKSASTHKEHVYLTSTIVHSESASGHDASAASTTKADPGKSDPNDSISQQQGIDKRPKTNSLDHTFIGTNPDVLVEKTKSASEGLETIHTKPTIRKGASYIEKEIEYAEDEFNASPDHSNSDDAKKEIKLEDLSKLMQNVDVDFMDLDSPEDDQPIIVHAEEPKETEDTSASHPLSPKTIQIQELSKQLPILWTLNSKMVKEREDDEAEDAWFKAQPSFLNVEQLTKLLVKSLKPKLSTLLTSHDFSKSLPNDLKELPFKFNDLSGEIEELKNLTTQVAKLKTLQWELPAEFISLPGQVSFIQAKIKTLDALPSLLSKVTKALDRFAHAIEQASHKAGGQGVPSVGQAGTHPSEGEKNTKQATITQLFKQKTKKDAEKANLNQQQHLKQQQSFLQSSLPQQHNFNHPSSLVPQRSLLNRRGS
ncbi:hypothetical protein Tco_0525670 [Tanacetum coccineum]